MEERKMKSFYSEFANKTLEELYEDRNKLNNRIEQLERNKLEAMRNELFKLAKEMGYETYVTDHLEYGTRMVACDIEFKKI